MRKSQKLSHVNFLKGISIAIGSVMSVDRAEKPLKSLWISISSGTIQDMLTKAASNVPMANNCHWDACWGESPSPQIAG